MRRVHLAILVAVLSTLTLAAPAAADTVGGPNGDRIVAGGQFTFVNGSGQTYAASADVIDDHLADTVLISASYFNSTTVTCPGDDPVDPSDDYEGSIETSFYAEAPTTTSTFGSKLSSATATGTVTGDITQFNSCTGEQAVIGQDTIQVAIDLAATGAIDSSVGHTNTTDEQGNRYVVIFKTSERPAAGTITFDGDAHDVEAVIRSEVWRTRPPG